MAQTWWNPFDGDVIPGVNVRNAVKQVTTGQDQDIFSGVTNSNRPGQLQVNSLPDWGVRGASTGGGGTGGGGGDTGGGGSSTLGSGGGAPSGAAALPALNMAAINNTQLALDQLPAILQAAIAAEQTRKANAFRGFDDQEQGQRKVYDGSTVTNQQNYDANYMDSIRSGIKGLGGLFNILRGTGAAGGTAQDQVRDVVGGVTANDIRTGADTQQANQTSLDTALSNFLTEIKGKRQMAEDTFANNESAIRRDNLSQQQDLFSKMASYYADGGRTADATNWMNRAGSLTPEIAKNSMAKQSSYDTSPVAVKAPELAAFSAPTQPDVAVATPDQVGAGIFTMNRKKEQQEQLPVALPAGA